MSEKERTFLSPDGGQALQPMLDLVNRHQLPAKFWTPEQNKIKKIEKQRSTTLGTYFLHSVLSLM